MLAEARELASIAPNLVVKVPLIADGIRLVKTLSDDGVQTNVTLCFSALQASSPRRPGHLHQPLRGALDDVGHDGMGLVEQIVEAMGTTGMRPRCWWRRSVRPRTCGVDPHGGGRGDRAVRGHR